ncbi:MAG: diguanylate cyclase [Fimbriimonas ginsengisoli]|uniref:Diguanylate cyclase n=1 Tax=Fimbriimonas ginsengisoli TaxID=1005039 RepID=A0A931M053_FIMGI|nr:diguanylate cyclase [Fimbriimonas ginsengisoli]
MNETLAAARDEVSAQRRVVEECTQRLAMQEAELSGLKSRIDRAHSLYAETARRMEDLFQGLPFACFGYDAEGRIHQWNRACEELFDLQAFQVLERSLEEVFGTMAAMEDLAAIGSKPFEGSVVEKLLWKRDREDGKTQWIETTAFPVRNEREQIVAAVCANLDITDRAVYEAQLEQSMERINRYSAELEAANQKLEQLAVTDGLTGLRNHRSFQQRLEASIADARETDSPIALVLLDVDHFKKFNDAYGHPEGDRVLQGVAAVLASYGDEPFTPARYGGEEFVLVLPGLAVEDALTTAERVRGEIEAAQPTGRLVTASLGLAIWTPEMRGPGELIAQADKALYKSKADGRNRVTLASSLWVDEKRAA